MERYPFKEGDDYYIVIKHKDRTYNLHEYEILWSCWDDVSEEIYNVEPVRKLFRTRNEAQEYINKLKKRITMKQYWTDYWLANMGCVPDGLDMTIIVGLMCLASMITIKVKNNIK